MVGDEERSDSVLRHQLHTFSQWGVGFHRDHWRSHYLADWDGGGQKVVGSYPVEDVALGHDSLRLALDQDENVPGPVISHDLGRLQDRFVAVDHERVGLHEVPHGDYVGLRSLKPEGNRVVAVGALVRSPFALEDVAAAVALPLGHW